MKIEQVINIDIQAKLDELKSRRQFQNILGIIGDSSAKSVDQAREILVPALTLVARDYRFAVLSGGTRSGIPELATTTARSLGLPTLGVFPEDETKRALVDLLDLAIMVPRPIYSQMTWGSESSVLTSIPTEVILFGGSWGTVIEVAMLMKNNFARIKHGKQTIPIISVSGFTGANNLLDPSQDSLPIPDNICIQVDSADTLAAALRERFKYSLFVKN